MTSTDSLTHDTLMTLASLEKFFTEEERVPVCDYVFENLGRLVWYNDNYPDRMERLRKLTSEIYKYSGLDYDLSELTAGFILAKPVTFEALYLGLLSGNT